jgi:hypothetical protein
MRALGRASPAGVIARRLGVSPRIVYRWRKTYGMPQRSEGKVTLYSQLHRCACGYAAVWLTLHDPAEKRLRGTCPECTRPVHLVPEKWDYIRTSSDDDMTAWFLHEVEHSGLLPLSLYALDLLAGLS